MICQIIVLIFHSFIRNGCHSQTSRITNTETNAVLQLKETSNCTLIKQENVDGLELDCSHKDFDSVPTCHELLPYNCSHITRIKLNNNNIAEIKNGSFIGFDNVRTLSLSSNPIETFHDYSFIGMNSLQTLDIRNISPQTVEEFLQSS